MAYHGKNGNAKFTNDLVHLQSWSASASADTDETTSMGATWQTHLIGFSDFTATAEGLSKKALVTTDIIGTGAELNLVLEAAAGGGGPMLKGTAICTSVSESVPYDGNGTVSYSFECNDTAGLVYSATGGLAAPAVANAFHGKTSGVSVVAVAVTSHRGWSINLTCSTEETTVAGQAAKTRMAGFKGATASVMLLADGDFEFAVGTGYDLRLHRTAGTAGDGYYALETPASLATCTGAEPGMDKNGIAVVNYNFEYSGQVTLKVA